MAVRQVSKKDGTKDGRRWCFYTYIKDIIGNKKGINLKSITLKKKLKKLKEIF